MTITGSEAAVAVDLSEVVLRFTPGYLPSTVGRFRVKRFSPCGEPEVFPESFSESFPSPPLGRFQGEGVRIRRLAVAVLTFVEVVAANSVDFMCPKIS